MSLLQKSKCLFGFHALRYVRDLAIGGHLYECYACRKCLCIHHGRKQVIPYDAEIELFEKQVRDLKKLFRD